MKNLYIILALFLFGAVSAHSQTLKTLSYNTTNGFVVAATNVTFTNSVGFATNAQAATRTNLGLVGTWLTNSIAPLFWTSVPSSPTNSGTAGQVAYTNNYLYICISNNTWRRVQLGTW